MYSQQNFSCFLNAFLRLDFFRRTLFFFHLMVIYYDIFEYKTQFLKKFLNLISLIINTLLTNQIIGTIIICKFKKSPYNTTHRDKTTAQQNERRRKCPKVFLSKSPLIF